MQYNWLSCVFSSGLGQVEDVDETFVCCRKCSDLLWPQEVPVPCLNPEEEDAALQSSPFWRFFLCCSFILFHNLHLQCILLFQAHFLALYTPLLILIPLFFLIPSFISLTLTPMRPHNPPLSLLILGCLSYFPPISLTLSPPHRCYTTPLSLSVPSLFS